MILIRKNCFIRLATNQKLVLCSVTSVALLLVIVNNESIFLYKVVAFRLLIKANKVINIGDDFQTYFNQIIVICSVCSCSHTKKQDVAVYTKTTIFNKFVTEHLHTFGFINKSHKIGNVCELVSIFAKRIL